MTYEITLRRVTTQAATVLIEAANETEASDLAINMTNTLDWEWGTPTILETMVTSANCKSNS